MSSIFNPEETLESMVKIIQQKIYYKQAGQAGQARQARQAGQAGQARQAGQPELTVGPIKDGDILTKKNRLLKSTIFTNADEQIILGSSSREYTNVEHFLNIDKIDYHHGGIGRDGNPIPKHIVFSSTPKEFNRVEIIDSTSTNSSIKLIQECKINFDTDYIPVNIEFKLRTPDDSKYYYNSIYDVIDGPKATNATIKYNPVFKEGGRNVIKPVTRNQFKIEKLGEKGDINIYIFLNELLGKSKLKHAYANITHETDYTVIKKIFDDLNKEYKETSDQKIINFLKYSQTRLESEQHFNKYKELLYGFQHTDYVYDPTDKLETIKEKVIKIDTIKKLSNADKELLERIKPYDKERKINIKVVEEQITLQDKTKIISPAYTLDNYNFSVTRPYLVSDILTTFRENTVGTKRVGQDALVQLKISKDNIYDFAKFIHEFKSGGLEVLSLCYDILKKKLSSKTIIEFNHSSLYKGSRWFSNLKNIGEKVKKYIKYENNAPNKLQVLQNLTDPIDYILPLLPLDEPHYTTNSYDPCDFDILYGKIILKEKRETEMQECFDNLFTYRKSTNYDLSLITLGAIKAEPAKQYIMAKSDFPELVDYTPAKLVNYTPAPSSYASAITKSRDEISEESRAKAEAMAERARAEARAKAEAMAERARARAKAMVERARAKAERGEAEEGEEEEAEEVVGEAVKGPNRDGSSLTMGTNRPRENRLKKQRLMLNPAKEQSTRKQSAREQSAREKYLKYKAKYLQLKKELNK
jgi:hypothetical protein